MFEGELCDVPPCFSVNCTDQIYQGKKSWKGSHPSCQPPSGHGVISKALILEASPLFRKFFNVDVPDFHEFGIVIQNNIKQVANTFGRVWSLLSKQCKSQIRQGRGAEDTRITEISDDAAFSKDFLNFVLCNADNKNLRLHLASKLVSLHEQFDDHN